MDDDNTIYIWECYIPSKWEARFWQACILLGIDIHDDDEFPCAEFNVYTILVNSGLQRYSVIDLYSTDQCMKELTTKLKELGVSEIDIFLIGSEEELIWATK